MCTHVYMYTYTHMHIHCIYGEESSMYDYKETQEQSYIFHISYSADSLSCEKGHLKPQTRLKVHCRPEGIQETYQ
jgi:hypothetical protein